MGRLYVMIYTLPLHMIVILAAKFLVLCGLLSESGCLGAAALDTLLQKKEKIYKCKQPPSRRMTAVLCVLGEQ